MAIIFFKKQKFAQKNETKPFKLPCLYAHRHNIGRPARDTGIGHLTKNYLKPIQLLPKKTSFREVQ